MRVLFFMILGSFGMLFYDCSYKKIENQSPAINIVEKNQKFCVNLPENHTNGEFWQLTNDVDELLIHNLGSVWHGNEKGVDFNLSALSSGQYTLNFVKRIYSDSVETRRYIVKIVD